MSLNKLNYNEFVCKIINIIKIFDGNIIKWNIEMNGFIILDINQFTKIILPNYFNIHSFNYFIKIINGYKFKKNKNKKYSSNQCEFIHRNLKRKIKECINNIDLISNQNNKDIQVIQNLIKENEFIKKEIEKANKTYQDLVKKFNEFKIRRFFQSESPQISLDEIYDNFDDNVNISDLP